MLKIGAQRAPKGENHSKDGKKVRRKSDPLQCNQEICKNHFKNKLIFGYIFHVAITKTSARRAPNSDN